MKVLITGACGFVGSTVAECLMERREVVQVYGVDNLLRPGSEASRSRLRELGVSFIHGDIRMASDVDALPAADWVIDAAANPSVLAGVQGYSIPVLTALPLRANDDAFVLDATAPLPPGVSAEGIGSSFSTAPRYRFMAVPNWRRRW